MSTLIDDETLDRLKVRQIIADIDQKRADTERKQQEVRLAPWTIALTVMAGAAAFFAAGATFVRLLH